MNIFLWRGRKIPNSNNKAITHISCKCSSGGKRSPSKRKWLHDKFSHSSDISGINSSNGNLYRQFSCIISHLSEWSPVNRPGGMVSMRFRRKFNCFKWICEWNVRAGNSDMLFSPKSLYMERKRFFWKKNCYLINVNGGRNIETKSLNFTNLKQFISLLFETVPWIEIDCWS